jgi:hypoxanthine phosphoribosyltransferase
MNAGQTLKVLYDSNQIAQTVTRLAGEIDKDYAGKKILLVGVLKGAFVFMADLIRKLDIPTEIEFIGLSSYEYGQQSKGKVKITKALECGVEGRDVLVVEDIIDTGLTTEYLLDELRQMKPKTLKLCCLLDKSIKRQVEIKIDYKGLEVPGEFIVGYGLDYAEKYRHLPDVCYLEDG